MTWIGRLSLLGIFVFTELTIGGRIPEFIGLAVLALLVFAAWRNVPRFWRLVGGGAIGGVVAGLLILGPGLRLAMRVVAIMDPLRTPEFSIGGTGFLVVGIGGIMGGILALNGHLLRRAFGISSALIAGSLIGLYFIGSLIVFSPDIRAEFFDLGAGPWVNIPMFTVYAVAYGIAAMAVADRFETRKSNRQSVEREKVPA